MAQWIRRWSTKPEILGLIPSGVVFLSSFTFERPRNWADRLSLKVLRVLRLHGPMDKVGFVPQWSHFCFVFLLKLDKGIEPVAQPSRSYDSMAQWIRRWSTKPEILGSIPSEVVLINCFPFENGQMDSAQCLSHGRTTPCPNG